MTSALVLCDNAGHGDGPSRSGGGAGAGGGGAGVEASRGRVANRRDRGAGECGGRRELDAAIEALRREVPNAAKARRLGGGAAAVLSSSSTSTSAKAPRREARVQQVNAALVKQVDDIAKAVQALNTPARGEGPRPRHGVALAVEPRRSGPDRRDRARQHAQELRPRGGPRFRAPGHDRGRGERTALAPRCARVPARQQRPRHRLQGVEISPGDRRGRRGQGRGSGLSPISPAP